MELLRGRIGGVELQKRERSSSKHLMGLFRSSFCSFALALRYQTPQLQELCSKKK
jgi:hypothetical protein